MPLIQYISGKLTMAFELTTDLNLKHFVLTTQMLNGQHSLCALYTDQPTQSYSIDLKTECFSLHLYCDWSMYGLLFTYIYTFPFVIVIHMLLESF